MPNVSTTVYLSDDDYVNKFKPRKKEIMQKMRDFIRAELDIESGSDNRLKVNRDKNKDN